MVGFAELPAPRGTRFWSVRLTPETGSTNADLLGAAGTGAPEGLVLVTDHQRAGRGRQQRVWHDEPGSALLVSVLLRPGRRSAPLIPLATGLAAVDTVQAVAGPTARIGLKWPNDVLAPDHDERKLAGILAEATTSGGPEGALAVVVGMGMNLRPTASSPDDVAARSITLTELAGRPVERDRVLDRFLRALDGRLAQLDGDPSALLADYRSACLTIGRRVRFATGDGDVDGIAVGVSASGALELDRGDGRPIELNAGDAHHR